MPTSPMADVDDGDDNDDVVLTDVRLWRLQPTKVD